MILNSQSYEEQTRGFLIRAKDELNVVNEKIRGLEKEREALNKEVEAYETALENYLRRTGKPSEPQSNQLEALRGRSHREQLEIIARMNNGRLKVAKAVDLLLQQGLIKTQKRSTAYVMVQKNVSNMVADGTLMKVIPGEYRLTGAQSSFVN